MKKRDLVKQLMEMGWGPKEFSELLSELKQDAEGQQVKKSEPSEIRINEFLKEMGISYKLLGRRYLVDVISYAIEKKDFYLEDIYRQIAEKYGKKGDSIERAVRYALGSAFDNQNPNLKNIFGYSINNKKGEATVLEFVYAAIEYLETPKKSN